MDYYRLTTLTDEFNISLDRLRYGVENGAIPVSLFLSQTSIVYGYFSKTGFVGQGAALYEGIISLFRKEALTLLSDKSIKIDRFILRQINKLTRESHTYPFITPLPNKVFAGWEETESSATRALALVAYCYPTENQSASSMVSQSLQGLPSVLDKPELRQFTQSLSSRPAWYFDMPKVEVNRDNICFLAEDLKKADLFSSGKRGESLLNIMVKELINAYPSKGGAALWKLVTDELWLESSPFESTNIVIDIEKGKLTWRNQKEEDSTITKASFENLVSKIKKSKK